MRKYLSSFLVLLMVVCLMGGCGKSEVLKQAEKEIDNHNFSAAEELTAGGSGEEEDLNLALNAYLDLANSIQMQYVHAIVDDSRESEIEAAYESAQDIPKAYKDYKELKKCVELYQDKLKDAVDLENDLRDEYPEMKELYSASKSSKYTALADEWVEKIDKTFPVSEDGLSEEPDEEEMLNFELNEIFKLGIMNYTTAGYDWVKLSLNKFLTTEEIDAMMDNLADLHSAIIDTMTSEEFGFDEKDPEYYTKIDICPDPDYDGIRIEVDAELSYHELDKLREVLDKTLNKYVKHAHFDVAEPGILETYFASSDIIPDNISSSKIVAGRYDVPERPLDPPEYDEGDEIQTEASVVIPFNQVITVNQDGSWDYSDDEYNFTKTEDGRSDHYDDEYHVYLDDNIGIVEKLDDFLESKLPATPGTYRIQGDLTLVYDIENIVSYSNNDGYWSEEDGFNPPSYEISTDSAESYYNKSKSHLDNFKYTKIK